MKNFNKYVKSHFMPPVTCYDWINKDIIEKAPLWCSVDLRDGNQALVEPMSLDEKVEFFKLLVAIGFKDIEVGFPAASETEFQFLRTIIEENLIPDDVTIQVLTQAREHIIRRTFEALKGAPQAVVHLYNSTSVAQREIVFRKTKEEVKEIAVAGAKLLDTLAQETDGNFIFQYSPESFSGTEVDYALEVCNAVLDVWKPSAERKAIINMPTTVENSMPHVFASQVAYFDKFINYRENVIICLHPHNDRGCAVATAELGLLAGADRVEGTLFGNGERTGNVDLITVAMNMYSQGVNPELDFSNMAEICEVYERLTRMKVYERQPYSGEFVFTAFSGSHQDAIAKGITYREQNPDKKWNVPYLPIDPKDIGREYGSDVIRINSQSGKGGVNYILKQNYGISLPTVLQPEVGYCVKDASDKSHKELTPELIYRVFEDQYISNHPIFTINQCEYTHKDGVIAQAIIHCNEETHTINGVGNGPLDAISNAIKQYLDISYELSFFEEHSLSRGSSSKAIAYVGIACNGKKHWGVGIGADIIQASVDALVVAVNKCEDLQNIDTDKDRRLIAITNYINANYPTVTLDVLAEEFYLSKPYLSKYIKIKSGMTFGEILRKVRLKKAKALLKGGNMSIENISLTIGYQNVEHFIRIFKKTYNMTPVQYRNK